MQDDDSIKPRLTLRIGVTGHRPNRLSETDMTRLRALADEILGQLAAAAEDVGRQFPEAFQRAEHGGRAARIRLVTALAEGADTLVAEAAVAQGHELDVVLPFEHAAYADAQGFDAAAIARFDRLLASEGRAGPLELETPADLGDPSQLAAAYLAAGRTMLSHCDVLLALWNGEQAAGTGGTGQIVEEALARGLAVIWLPAHDDGPPRIWQSPTTSLQAAGDGGEWVARMRDDGRFAEALSERIRHMLQPPASTRDTGGDEIRYSGTVTRVCPDLPADRRSEAAAGGVSRHLLTFYDEPVRKGSCHFLYDALRFILAGRRAWPWVDYRPGPARDETWSGFLARARELGGENFARGLTAGLCDRWARADNAALHFAHVYRSAYILNFLLAALAVATGLVSVFFWEALQFKAVVVAIELGIVVAILVNTRRGRRRHWHRRWLQYRTIAEMLRPARLPALVGASAGRTVAPVGRADDWVTWYVRACLREIRPPAARIDRRFLLQAITVGVSEEIGDGSRGQIAYHVQNAEQLHRIGHRLHCLGEVSFWLVAAAAGAFVAVYLVEWPEPKAPSVSMDLKKFVTFFAGVLPAVGAALAGIRATGEFPSFQRQSMRTVEELARIHLLLQAEKSRPSLARVAALFGAATQAMTTDLRVWRQIYDERELALPA